MRRIDHAKLYISEKLLHFLILITGIDDLLQREIPNALKKLDSTAFENAERALAAEFQKLDEEYAACCKKVSELAADLPSVTGKCYLSLYMA